MSHHCYVATGRKHLRMHGVFVWFGFSCSVFPAPPHLPYRCIGCQLGWVDNLDKGSGSEEEEREIKRQLGTEEMPFNLGSHAHFSMLGFVIFVSYFSLDWRPSVIPFLGLGLLEVGCGGWTEGMVNEWLAGVPFKYVRSSNLL